METIEYPDIVCEDAIVGCTNSNACNYNPNANGDDGSCEYYTTFEQVFDENGIPQFDANGNPIIEIIEYPDIPCLNNLGCTNSVACNYDPNANVDDGTCVYAELFYDCYSECFNDVDQDQVCDELEISGCTDLTASNFNTFATDDDGSCIYLIYGCTNENACNYNPNANGDDGSCEYYTTFEQVFDENGIPQFDANGNPIMETIEYPDIVCEDAIVGCTNSNACNYNPNANGDDGSCEYYTTFEQVFDENGIPQFDANGNPIIEIIEYPDIPCLNNLGCTNSVACNYDPNANVDDGTCVYAELFYDCYSECFNDVDQDQVCDELEISGCTDLTASNFNPFATDDDGSCIYIIYGCTNENACNYNIDATNEDGSCEFSEIYFDCEGNCISDSDQDLICDEEDNCIDVVNPNQEDLDSDGEGDVCDYNDGIGIDEISENSPTLIKMIDVLGREQQEHKRGSILFYIYDNGNVVKRFIK